MERTGMERVDLLCEAIAHRRSLGVARIHADQPVARELVEQALAAADWAPQSWRDGTLALHRLHGREPPRPGRGVCRGVSAGGRGRELQAERAGSTAPTGLRRAHLDFHRHDACPQAGRLFADAGRGRGDCGRLRGTEPASGRQRAGTGGHVAFAGRLCASARCAVRRIGNFVSPARFLFSRLACHSLAAGRTPPPLGKSPVGRHGEISKPFGSCSETVNATELSRQAGVSKYKSTFSHCPSACQFKECIPCHPRVASLSP